MEICFSDGQYFVRFIKIFIFLEFWKIPQKPEKCQPPEKILNAFLFISYECKLYLLSMGVSRENS